MMISLRTLISLSLFSILIVQAASSEASGAGTSGPSRWSPRPESYDELEAIENFLYQRNHAQPLDKNNIKQALLELIEFVDSIGENVFHLHDPLKKMSLLGGCNGWLLKKLSNNLIQTTENCDPDSLDNLEMFAERTSSLGYLSEYAVLRRDECLVMIANDICARLARAFEKETSAVFETVGEIADSFQKLSNPKKAYEDTTIDPRVRLDGGLSARQSTIGYREGRGSALALLDPSESEWDDAKIKTVSTIIIKQFWTKLDPKLQARAKTTYTTSMVDNLKEFYKNSLVDPCGKIFRKSQPYLDEFDEIDEASDTLREVIKLRRSENEVFDEKVAVWLICMNFIARENEIWAEILSVYSQRKLEPPGASGT